MARAPARSDETVLVLAESTSAGSTDDIGSDPVGDALGALTGSHLLVIANQAFAVYRARMPLLRAAIAAGAKASVLHPDIEASEGSLDEGELLSTLRALSIERLDVEFLRTGVRLRTVWNLARYTVQLKRAKIDLVHVFNPACILLFALPTRMVIGGERLFVTFTGLGLDERRPIAFRLLLKTYGVLVGRKASLHFETREDEATFFRINARHANRTRVAIASGVNLERLARSPRSPSDGPVRVLFASRLVRNKGVFEYLAAARAVNEKLPGAARFMAVGDYEMDRSEGLSLSAFQEKSFAASVDYLGAITFDKLIDVLLNTDIVVLPSYREGCPKILMEAAAAGCAAVATDLPGTRLVVDPEATGLLFPLADQDTLNAQLIRLVGDPSLARRFGDRARVRATECFDQESLAADAVEFYQD